MSRVGLNPVSIPEGVTVSVTDLTLISKVLRESLIKNLILISRLKLRKIF